MNILLENYIFGDHVTFTTLLDFLFGWDTPPSSQSRQAEVIGAFSVRWSCLWNSSLNRSCMSKSLFHLIMIYQSELSPAIHGPLFPWHTSYDIPIHMLLMLSLVTWYLVPKPFQVPFWQQDSYWNGERCQGGHHRGLSRELSHGSSKKARWTRLRKPSIVEQKTLTMSRWCR